MLHSEHIGSEPTRNLGLDLVRVTEAAALAAGRFMGRGDKNAADKAAVDAMRLVLNSIDINGVVVIGEGEKDEAPMLYNGEHVGSAGPNSPELDIAVDPSMEPVRLPSVGPIPLLRSLLLHAARCTTPDHSYI